MAIPVVPRRTLESKTIVGNDIVGVRQRIAAAVQISGAAPKVNSPEVYPLDGAMFRDDLYLYADVQPECLIGDPSDVDAQVIMKAADQTYDVEKMKVVITDGTALSINVVGRVINIVLNTGATTYAALYTALGAAGLTGLQFIKPGTGAPLVVAPTDALLFSTPPMAQAVQDVGGLFTFSPGPRSIMVKQLSLVCGAGSVVSLYFQDKGGGSPRLIASGLDGNSVQHNVEEVLLSSEEVKVVETTKGVPVSGDKDVTLYLVKERVF